MPNNAERGVWMNIFFKRRFFGFSRAVRGSEIENLMHQVGHHRKAEDPGARLDVTKAAVSEHAKRQMIGPPISKEFRLTVPSG